MITDELLRSGLQAAAEDYEIPPGAVDAIHAQLTATEQSRQKGRVRSRIASLPRPRHWSAWFAVAAVAAVVVVGVTVAIGSIPTNSDSASSGGPAAGAPAVVHGGTPRAAPEKRTAAGSGTAESGTAESGPTSSRPIAPAPERVVKTGSLDLRADKGRVGPTLDQLSALATQEGGYVQSSQSETTGPDPSGQVTLRVPVAKFGTAVAAASHLTGVKVESLQTSGQDVTGQVVDLSARISALQKTRETYLTILERARSIGSVLAVQDRISGVQTQIEQLQGQRKLLDDRSAMSTLAVSVDQPTAAVAKPHHHRSGFSAAVHQSVRRFERGIDDIVSVVGPLLLIALVVGILGGLTWLGSRRLRRRMV